MIKKLSEKRFEIVDYVLDYVEGCEFVLKIKDNEKKLEGYEEIYYDFENNENNVIFNECKEYVKNLIRNDKEFRDWYEYVIKNVVDDEIEINGPQDLINYFDECESIGVEFI